jgi:hypothetical protein
LGAGGEREDQRGEEWVEVFSGHNL